MSQERTEAIVVRGVDFSETSRIVTFLSPDRGRLACMAAGARRPKSPYAPLLDTFNRVELVYYWKDGRSVQKLGEVALLDGFAGLKADLDKAVFATFPLELAAKVAQENEPSQGLYAALVRGLESMAPWTGDAKTHAAWQVLQLLTEAGFPPDLGEDSGQRKAAGKVRFSYDTGLVDVGTRSDCMLSADAVHALRTLARERDQCPVISQKAVGEGFGALRQYVTRQLESDFRSLRVIDQLFG